MEERVEYRVLQSLDKPAMIEQETPDVIPVKRADLEKEHSNLIARIHQLRRLLGYPPLPTGKQIERQAK